MRRTQFDANQLLGSQAEMKLLEQGCQTSLAVASHSRVEELQLLFKAASIESFHDSGLKRCDEDICQSLLQSIRTASLRTALRDFVENLRHALNLTHTWTTTNSPDEMPQLRKLCSTGLLRRWVPRSAPLRHASGTNVIWTLNPTSIQNQGLGKARGLPSRSVRSRI